MTPAPARGSFFWRLVAALAIVANIGMSYYSNARKFNGQSMGEVSAKYSTLLTPAGYAFSIWGLIYLSLVIYAVWQLLPAQRNNPLPDAVAKSLALANVASAAWVVIFAHEQILLSVLTMLVLLAATAYTYGTARDMVRAQNVAPRWVSIPFALLLGWVCVATVLNVSLGLHVAGIGVSGSTPENLAFLMLGVLIVLILVLARAFQERTLPLVAGWALVAVWTARVSAYPVLGWTALSGAVVVVILGLVLAQQGRKLQPWEVSAAAAAAAEAEARSKAVS